VATPSEVDAPRVAQELSWPTAEGDRRGEHWSAWPIGEAAGRQPLETGPHLNSVGPGVEVEGPQGVAVASMKGGGGGVTVGATTAAAAVGSAVVTSPSSALRLSRLVIIGHQRWWRSTLGGGIARQGGDAAEGGWGGRPLGFGRSGSEKRNLSSYYHIGDRYATKYWMPFY
jgi:hypothetical protein